MKIAVKTFVVSCILAACGAQLLPCAPDCSEHHTLDLFPDPHDCTKYFECSQRSAISRTCPDELYFNPVIRVCDFPDSVECTADPDLDCRATSTDAPANVTAVASTTDVVGTTTVPSTTTVVTNYTVVPTTGVAPATTTIVDETTTDEPVVITTSSSGSTIDSGECTPECPCNECLFPNPRECTSYFHCAFGVPHLSQCPEGQWYDAPNERCDYPELAECNAGPDTPCVAVTAPTVQPPETTTGGSSASTIDGGEDCVPPCPSDEAMYPNPRDCSSFFLCSFGTPFLMQCPPGQEFSAELERCDYPEVAQCTAGPDSPCIAVTNPPQMAAVIR